MAAALAAPLGAQPGATFAYRGASTYLLPRLFTPLGIANPQWHPCPLGFSLGATGLFLRTGEIAALTRLLLEAGCHDDAQLVPADFVRQMAATVVDAREHRSTNATAPHPQSSRHGLGIWHCTRDDAWRMDGIYGQLGIVLPHHQACVAVTAHHQGATNDILDAIWAEIVPSLR